MKDVLKENKISILLAEDHPLMRKAVRVTLEEDPDLVVVGEAKDGREAIEMADRLLPDLIIMDVSMPLLNGLEATQRIKAQHPAISILILTVHDDIEHVTGMLESGADGYLTKEASDLDLVNGVHAIISGEAVITKPIFNQIIERSLKKASKPIIDTSVIKLTGQDLEILKLVASGLSNSNIAAKLNLSPFTIKNYLVEIFSKLQVSSRTEAVTMAIRTGLIRLEDF